MGGVFLFENGKLVFLSFTFIGETKNPGGLICAHFVDWKLKAFSSSLQETSCF